MNFDAISAGLSDKQREALDLDGRGLISAGAGAGKTQTLSALVCRDILVDGINPDQILVCTFTRAAAANLVNRIAANLALAAPDGHVDLTAMWVGTIDSISARLLRQGSLQAGLSPGFTIADERRLWPYQKLAIEQSLDSLSDEDYFYLSLLGDPSALTIKQKLVRLADQLRSQGRNRLEVTDPGRTDFDDLIAEIDTLIATAPPLTETQQKKGILAKLIQDRDALAARDAAAFSNRKYGAVGKGKEEFFRAAQALPLDSAPLILFAEENYPVRKAVAAAVNDYIAVLDKIKQSEELVDLIDVANLAAALLRDGYLPKIERLYIDEAQDTNPGQLAILSALAGGRQIAVGDSNQSIYGFRSADLAAFRAQRAEAEQTVELSDNYRSGQKILDFVNTVAAQAPELAGELVTMEGVKDGGEVEVLVMSDDEAIPSVAEEASGAWPEIDKMRQRLGLDYSGVAILCRSNSEASGYADVLRQNGVPTLLIQKRGLAAREECRDLLAFLALVDDEDNEAALIRVLTSPFLALSDQELVDLFSLPRPLFAQLEKLQPQFVARYRSLKARALRPSQLASEAVHLYGVDLTLDSLDATGALRRNIEKLIESIAGVEAALDGSSLTAVLARFEAEEEAGIDEGQDSRLPEGLDAVRVMTVHQAKGDEFPLTVFARISKRLPSNSDNLFLDSDGNLGLGYDGKEDEVANRVKEERKAAGEEEERRLAYVALTRAEQGLVLVASCKTRKDETASWQGMASWLFGDILALALPPEKEERRKLTSDHHGQALTADFLLKAIKPKIIAEEEDRRLPLALAPAGERSFQIPSQAAPLSYTALSNWGRCSLRRHLERDLGLKFRQREAGEHAGGARLFGIRFHELLAGADWSNPAALPELSADDAERELLEELAQSDLASRLSRAEIIFVERDFTLAIGTYLLQGTIDLLARDEEGLFIVDWKTGSESERFAGEYALQRRLYAAAVLSGDFGSEVEAIWYQVGSGEAKRERFTSVAYDNIRREINQILTEPIAPASNVFEPFCRDCPGLQQVCPVSSNQPPVESE